MKRDKFQKLSHEAATKTVHRLIGDDYFKELSLRAADNLRVIIRAEIYDAFTEIIEE